MAKISVGSGPSDKYANPGDTAVDALGRVSALHPDEQGALTPQGDRDDSLWLKEGDEEWPGNSSSQSDESKPSTSEKSSNSDQSPAPTTENLSDPDPAANSGARSTVGAGKAAKR